MPASTKSIAHKPINRRQLRFYRGLWADVRKQLRKGGFGPKEADEMRMEIHTQAGALADGKPKSSLALNNKEFTRIKPIFLSWTEPENLDAQLKAEDQDLILARGKIRILIQDVEMSEGHLQAMSEKLFGRPFQVLANPQLMKGSKNPLAKPISTASLNACSASDSNTVHLGSIRASWPP